MILDYNYTTQVTPLIYVGDDTMINPIYISQVFLYRNEHHYTVGITLVMNSGERYVINNDEPLARTVIARLGLQNELERMLEEARD